MDFKTHHTATHLHSRVSQHTGATDFKGIKDRGASAIMTPHHHMVNNAKKCNTNITLADGTTITKDILLSTFNASVPQDCCPIPFPRIPAYVSSDLTETLLSEPSMVHEGNLAFVSSQLHGASTQPAHSDPNVCPIYRLHLMQCVLPGVRHLPCSHTVICYHMS